MKKPLCSSWTLLFAMTLCVHGQKCELVGKDDDTLNRRLGKPVIFGPAFEVPALAWRFQSPTAPASIEARYQWLWIQYPYPQHAFGAWESGEETIACAEPSLEMVVPSHTVRPRGWYSGTHTSLPWKKPKFDQVEFVIMWDRNCQQRLMLSPKVLAKFRDHEAVLKRSCGAPELIQFVPKKKP
ncbi:MAG: hypothetical protein ACK5TN_07515 [Acidobacteriota bacterium]|jgi:hypothetical protein